ncbi:hypothetical protein ACFLZ8_00325 [Planctomycetota bacterium]
MKSIISQPKKLAAFTIVELLTVMSVIVILIGLLVPSLNKVRQYAYQVKQQAQFHSIDAAVELFNSEFDGYPDSGPTDMDGVSYCGSMKLAEAMVGQDLLGFHPDSIFRADGWDNSRQLYADEDNLNVDTSARKGPYLPLENANAYRIGDLYNDTGTFETDHFVLCDVYRNVTNKATGRKVGMPILYYKADTTKNLHDPETPDSDIYDYRDNLELLALGWPGEESSTHQLAEAGRFYLNTQNTQITSMARPFREDTYILISAGWDGEYGTPDDICNFDFSYKE